MLDANLDHDQLKTHLEKVTRPIELVASLDDGPKSTDLWSSWRDRRAVATTSPSSDVDDDDRRPSFAINRVGTDVSVRFAGIPLGHEFTSLVLALLQVGGHPSTASAETVRPDRGARRRLPLRDLLLALLPELPRRRAGAQPDERAQPAHHPRRHRRRPVPGRGRRAPGDGRPDRVPQRRAVRPGPHDASSRSSPSSTPARPTAAADGSTRRTRSTCSSSAAVPPAPRPRSTPPARASAPAIAAERFGGQVLDTMAIENFVSVPYTEGPQLARPRSSSTSRSTTSTS